MLCAIINYMEGEVERHEKFKSRSHYGKNKFKRASMRAKADFHAAKGEQVNAPLATFQNEVMLKMMND